MSQANGSLQKPQVNAFSDPSAFKKQKASGGSALGGLFSVAARYDPIVIPTARRLSQDTIPVPVPVLLPELPKLPIPLDLPKIPEIAVPVPMQPPPIPPPPNLPLLQPIPIPKIVPEIPLPIVHPPEQSSSASKPFLPGILPIPGPPTPGLSLPGIIPPPATPMFEVPPIVPGLKPLPQPGAPLGAAVPLFLLVPDLAPSVPKLPRVPTLPEVSLFPGVPNIPLLPPPAGIGQALQGLGDLGPLNVAGMFEGSPAHLTAFPTIKYIPKELLHWIKKIPIIGDKFLFNAVVMLPVPKKKFEPPTLPHAAIPGMLSIDTIIHSLFGDVLWNALPGFIRGPLHPVKRAISRGLGMASMVLRCWQVYWLPNLHHTDHPFMQRVC